MMDLGMCEEIIELHRPDLLPAFRALEIKLHSARTEILDSSPETLLLLGFTKNELEALYICLAVMDLYYEEERSKVDSRKPDSKNKLEDDDIPAQLDASRIRSIIKDYAAYIALLVEQLLDLLGGL